MAATANSAIPPSKTPSNTLVVPLSKTTKPHTPDIFEIPGGSLLPRQAKPTVAEIKGAEYVGCYQNGAQLEILTMTNTYDFDLTPELCRNVCQQATAVYFGMQNGYDCFCGEQVEPIAVSADESECDEECNGATSVLCGGNARVNIYSITSTVAGGVTGGINTQVVTITTTNAGGSTITSTALTTHMNVDGGESSADDTSSGSDSNENSNSTPIGAIIGGVVGGVAVMAIIAGIFIWICFKRMRKEVANARAEAVAVREQKMPPTGTGPAANAPIAQPEAGFYDQPKPERAGSICTLQTNPQSPPPQRQREGYWAPPPTETAKQSGGILPARQHQRPQELNDTARRIYEMGPSYSR